MAIQLAAIPLLGKLGAAVKGAFSLGKGAKYTQKALDLASVTPKAAAVGGGQKGFMRMAGDKLKSNFAKAYAPDPVTGSRGIMASIAPDLAYGVLGGVMTPGDLGDKVIAGVTDATIGAGMTGGLRGAAGAKLGSGLGMAIEYGGGALSPMLSMPATNALLRVKGGGKSPYDKLQEQQYEQMRAQIEQEILAGMGGGMRTRDAFLQVNGLG